jgi:hypothetical protein
MTIVRAGTTTTPGCPWGQPRPAPRAADPLLDSGILSVDSAPKWGFGGMREHDVVESEQAPC